MQTLSICLIQGATRWLDAPANCVYYSKLIQQAARDTDLVVLPETFLSGFSNDIQKSAETMEGPGVAWMRTMAAETGAVIIGSLAIREGEKAYNRLIWMYPEGHYHYYDKRHLFRMAGEHDRYHHGKARLIVEYKGWRILPQICYDLRFPVWLRNQRCEQAYAGMQYDLALFVANWPVPRREAWRILLRARAIENLSYVIGVNRVGTDGNHLTYAGDSVAIDPYGQALLELSEQEQVVNIQLDPAILLAHRERFPAWLDADQFTLQN